MTIPIRNIYYLLLYAWDCLEEREEVLVQDLQSTEIAELFGRLLHGSVERLFRRGIDRTYIIRTEQLAGVRGRVDLTNTLTRGLLARGHTICHFDELSVDGLLNRIVKSACERILAVRPLDPAVTSMMRECVALLRGVRSVPLTAQLCRAAQLHQNNSAYRLPLAIANLLATNLLVDEKEGTVMFRDFSREDGPLALLFQSFVLNFLRREQSAFQVMRRTVRWSGLSGSARSQDLIPVMLTDVSLERAGHTAVIETKFYRQPFVEHYQSRRVRSDHLYQLYAYVKNLGHAGGTVDGILLYAQVGQTEDVEVELQGHRLRILTLDLSASWESIHDHLEDVVRWAERSIAA